MCFGAFWAVTSQNCIFKWFLTFNVTNGSLHVPFMSSTIHLKDCKRQFSQIQLHKPQQKDPFLSLHWVCPFSFCTVSVSFEKPLFD